MKPDKSADHQNDEEQRHFEVLECIWNRCSSSEISVLVDERYKYLNDGICLSDFQQWEFDGSLVERGYKMYKEAIELKNELKRVYRLQAQCNEDNFKLEILLRRTIAELQSKLITQKGADLIRSSGGPPLDLSEEQRSHSATPTVGEDAYHVVDKLTWRLICRHVQLALNTLNENTTPTTTTDDDRNGTVYTLCTNQSCSKLCDEEHFLLSLLDETVSMDPQSIIRGGRSSSEERSSSPNSPNNLVLTPDETTTGSVASNCCHSSCRSTVTKSFRSPKVEDVLVGQQYTKYCQENPGTGCYYSHTLAPKTTI